MPRDQDKRGKRGEVQLFELQIYGIELSILELDFCFSFEGIFIELVDLIRNYFFYALWQNLPRYPGGSAALLMQNPLRCVSANITSTAGPGSSVAVCSQKICTICQT